MKAIKEYLADANKMVPKLSVAEAIAWHEAGKGIFVDIRDGLTIRNTGIIPGFLHIPLGFIEFAADDSTDLHHGALKCDSMIVLMCMAGKTLIELGYRHVVNGNGFMPGGIPAAPLNVFQQTRNNQHRNLCNILSMIPADLGMHGTTRTRDIKVGNNI